MAMDFVAGCIGGCAGVIVGHPFDTIKVRLQIQDYRNPTYSGSIDCFRSIIQKESVNGLFKGMSSPMVGVSVINAIVFGVQGNLQRRLPNPDSLTSHFVSGTAAGLAQSVFCSPMELVKTRIQVQQEQKFKGPWGCLKSIFQTEGLRGVFRGLGITALREGPGFGVYFFVYELLTKTESQTPISTFHMLMAGGTAGSASWLLAYPVDVIKTRLQVDGMSGPRLYKNATDCLVQSVRTDGWRCLTRGINLTMIRAFPVNAATWATVTWVFRFAENAKQQEDCYTKISELKDSKIYLPELSTGPFSLSRSFYAEAASFNSKTANSFWNRENLGRSTAYSCSEYYFAFHQLFSSYRESWS